jgi:hypothetical protein
VPFLCSFGRRKDERVCRSSAPHLQSSHAQLEQQARRSSVSRAAFAGSSFVLRRVAAKTTSDGMVGTALSRKSVCAAVVNHATQSCCLLQRHPVQDCVFRGLPRTSFCQVFATILERQFILYLVIAMLDVVGSTLYFFWSEIKNYNFSSVVVFPTPTLIYRCIYKIDDHKLR